MKVYVVLEVVDLGYHIVSIHFKEEDAASITAELQAKAEAMYVVGRTYYYWVEQTVV